MLVMSAFLALFAAVRSDAWTVNPSEYRYDMSLYFSLSSKDYVNLDKYEIGAFIDDECRGLAEKVELDDGADCMLLRIRSNSAAAGQEVVFKMRDRETDTVVILKGMDGESFTFRADQTVGLPSAPYIMSPYYNVTVIAGEHGTVDFESGMYAEGTVLELKAIPDYGYRFDVWSDGNQDAERTITVTGDIELTATFVSDFYTAVFKIDGEVFATLKLEYGATIEAPEAPEKEGYTFSGWQDLPEKMPAHDVEVEGSYTVNTYTVTFTIDGEVVETLSVEYGAAIEAPEAPEKEGYTFSGWQNLPETMPAHDVEVSAVYTLNSYQLVFLVDGEVVETLSVEYGAAIEAPEAPEKEGYTFSGWQNLPETMPAHDVEVNAVYVPNTYQVTFLVDDEVFETLSFEYGAPIEAPEGPEKEGYTFAGWAALPATMPARNIQVSAVYVFNSYQITFKLDGEVLETRTLLYKAVVEAPEVPEKEGYTFSGWQNLPETMPAHDVEVEGNYIANTYQAIFIIDGEIFATLSVEYGAVINAPAAPEREDYTFTGWEDLPETMPAHDIVLTGTYVDSDGKYDVLFMIDGETVATMLVEEGATIELPEAPEKEGYTFDGWQDVPEVMPNHDVVITGSYTVNTYTVIFIIDGEIYETLSVEYGAVINAPAAPEREDYTFTGWEGLPETMPAHDIEVSGTYVDSDGKYDVLFMIDGETVATMLVEEGATIELPEAPEKEGYTFDGWRDVPEVMPNHDVVITGSYTVNTYTVIFIVNGETIETRTVEYGATIEAPEMPEKEGYTFSGWLNLPETMPAQSIEIVGNYHPNLYMATFIIDGEVFETVSVEYGSVINVPVVPEKEDYTFSGWTGLPETMPAHDIEVTGEYIYSPNIFKAVFVIDGEIFETLTLKPGETVIAPEVPEKEGYTFSGWQDMPETMPHHDVVIMGNYTVNSYTATFIIDGEVVETMSVEYGSVINVPAAPEKEDYTFDGWQDVPETMPAHDIEITGSYTYSVVVFNAVFMIDGEIIAVVPVEVGDPIELPVEPFREGYTFDGWQDVPETMPHHDVVITGSFTANNYMVIFMIGDEILDTYSLSYGATIETPEVPEKEGYTFGGWQNLPSTMPATDLVINGSYIANLYHLIVYLDGKVYLDEEIAYGAEVVIPEPEVPEGWQFDGWDIEIPETMPAHDLIIYGTLSVLSWVDSIAADSNDSLTVYDLNGVLLFKNVKAAEVKDQLAPGVYIINGYKVMVK